MRTTYDWLKVCHVCCHGIYPEFGTVSPDWLKVKALFSEIKTWLLSMRMSDGTLSCMYCTYVKVINKIWWSKYNAPFSEVHNRARCIERVPWEVLMHGSIWSGWHQVQKSLGLEFQPGLALREDNWFLE